MIAPSCDTEWSIDCLADEASPLFRGRVQTSVPQELVIHSSQDGSTVTVALRGDRMSLGRAADNDLSYPLDQALSRYHMVVELEGEQWFVRDIGSKNGTTVNGAKLTEKRRLIPGDQIRAGGLDITCRESVASDSGVDIVDEDPVTDPSSTSILTRLDIISAQENAGIGPDISDKLRGMSRIQALLDVGRELSGQRPLAELFPKILDLAIRAVGARRGALMTLENGELVLRACRGEGLRISRAVSRRIIEEKASLLVQDTTLDDALRGTTTIVQQSVRSLIAAPLQVEDRVTGLVYVDMPEVICPFTPEDLNLLTVMGNVAAIRIEHARLMEVEEVEKKLSKELEQAAEIQRSLLPRSAPVAPGLDVAGHSIPCLSVGGDYFDYLSLESGRLGVLVGDVAGKGLPAALLMSSLQARVQVLSEETEELDVLMTRLNRSVSSTCPRNRFITLFVSVIGADGSIQYSNAGHNPPLLLRTTGEVEKLETGGPVLGILKNMKYQAGSTNLNPGDVLVLFSDGVTEALNPAGDEYGEDRLISTVRKSLHQNASAITGNLQSDLLRFVSGRPAADDVTIVAVRRTA